MDPADDERRSTPPQSAGPARPPPPTSWGAPGYPADARNLRGSGVSARGAAARSSMSTGSDKHPPRMTADEFWALQPRTWEPPGGGKKRFYTVTRSPQRPGMVGIWHSSWQFVRSHFPQAHLEDCQGLHLHGFDCFEDALRWWHSHGHPERPPRVP